MNRIIPAPFVPLVCQLVIGFGAHAAGTEQQPVSAVPAPESGPRNGNGLVEEITVLGPEARGVVSGPLGPLSGYLSLSEFSDQGWPESRSRASPPTCTIVNGQRAHSC